MNTSKIIKTAFFNSALAIIYIAIIATILNNGEELFGKADNALSGIAFLLTFVFSAAVMGILIFGRPLLWYLDGLKKEALKLVFYTIGFLFLALLIIFLVLIVK